MYPFPMLKAPPWFGGQLGVPGSDSPLGFRLHPDAVVIYVDSGHADASDQNDGTDPIKPKATVASAVSSSLLVPHSVIAISGDVAENVSVSTAIADYVTIVGIGNGRYTPIWAPAVATSPCLTIDAYGWHVLNTHFQPGASSSGVTLTRVVGAGAEGTVIEGCFFDGLWGTGAFGIVLHGAPANVSIIRNRFAEFGSGDPCITIANTAVADPYQCHILYNTFQECDEYITSEVAGGWSQSIIAYNLFCPATHDAAYPAGAGGTAVYLKLNGATYGYNVVFGNTFPEDYSIAGGYTPGTGDFWMGNYAADTAEAEVGDNGLTIAVPT